MLLAGAQPAARAGRCSWSASRSIYAGGAHHQGAVDRPRPAGPLVDTSGSSLSERPRRLRDGLGRGGGGARRACCGLAEPRGARARRVVVAAAIGLTRIYLGAHYWSDVVGGLGARLRRLRPAAPRRAGRRPTSATMARASRPPIARADEPGPHHHRDRDRAGRRARRRRLHRPSSSCPRGAPTGACGSGSRRASSRSTSSRRCSASASRRARGRLGVRPLRLSRVRGRTGADSLATIAAAAGRQRWPTPAALFLDAFEDVSEAVEAGAGLPEVARAAGRALDASVIVLDSLEQRARGGLRVARRRARGARRRGDGTERSSCVADAASASCATASARPSRRPRSLLRMVATLIGARGRALARRPSAPARPRSATSSRDLLAARSPTARTSSPRGQGARLRPVRRRRA